MKTFSILNRATLAIACAALTFVGHITHAKAAPPVSVKLISANAGTSAMVAPRTDRAVFNSIAALLVFAV